MRVLHTSDWHIGKLIGNFKIQDVHAAYLSYLEQVIDEKKVDVLIISGDVFDTRSPSTTSQKLFYLSMDQLLKRTPLQHIVVTSGNHDSPSVLSMIAPILEESNLHIVTSCDVEDELLVLKDQYDKPLLQIMAAPFLREREIRTNASGTTTTELSKALSDAITAHFDRAEQEMEQHFNPDIPTIGMAHLFTAGSLSTPVEKGDGVREIYVGGLDALPPSIFPSFCNYMALGHIHVPQVVGKSAYIRYSGSPIPLGFSEKEAKQMILLDFPDGSTIPTIQVLSVPTFISLLHVRGKTKEEIFEKIAAYQKIKNNLTNLVRDTTYVEVVYTGEVSPTLKKELTNYLESLDGSWELSILNMLSSLKRLSRSQVKQELHQLSPRNVFTMIVGKEESEKYQSLFDQVFAEAEEEKARENHETT